MGDASKRSEEVGTGLNQMTEKTRQVIEKAGDRLGELRAGSVEHELPEKRGSCIPVKSAQGSWLGIWQNDRGHRFSDPVLPEPLSVDGDYFMMYPFDWANYRLLSGLLPWLCPRPAGETPSFGCGDRLGLVSAAHLRALGEYQVFPILAQQSPRELEKTHRTFRDVLLGAAWGILEGGNRVPFGADADHIKEHDSLQSAMDAGFTMYTLDVSGEARVGVETMSIEELEREYTSLPVDQKELYQRYLDNQYWFPGGAKVSFTETALLPLVLMYAPALAWVERLNEVLSGALSHYDLEISLDEGAAVSSTETHFLFAEELHRRGVDFQSLALRFPGSFEKGIDYLGDCTAFSASAKAHAAIAREIDGYRLSLHSGSDKFSIYPAWREATGGQYHVKTSGTSWLKALETVSLRDPSFFRELYALSLRTLSENRQAYHISTRDDEVEQSLDHLPDHRLVELFSHQAARQVLHIAYGALLDRHGERLRQFLFAEEPTHCRLVSDHIRDHAALLAEKT